MTCKAQENLQGGLFQTAAGDHQASSRLEKKSMVNYCDLSNPIFIVLNAVAQMLAPTHLWIIMGNKIVPVHHELQGSLCHQKNSAVPYHYSLCQTL
jgi:hypothetical protein